MTATKTATAISIRIRNGRDCDWQGEYIGRAMHGRTKRLGSPLGNPFKAATHTEEAHAMVVQLYKGWLWSQIKDESDRTFRVRRELQRLKNLTLENAQQGKTLQLCCWCKPLPCHGDVIRDCILWAIQTGYEFVEAWELEE